MKISLPQLAKATTNLFTPAWTECNEFWNLTEIRWVKRRSSGPEGNRLRMTKHPELICCSCSRQLRLFTSNLQKSRRARKVKTSARGFHTGREMQSFQELHHPLIFHLSFSKSSIISCPPTVCHGDHSWGTPMSLTLFTIIEKYLTLNVSFSD